MKRALHELFQDLKERHEPLSRAAIRLIAAYDPTDPAEAATLVHELAIAAGLSSQHEAQAIVRSWQTPVHSTHGDGRLQSVVMSGGVRVR